MCEDDGNAGVGNGGGVVLGSAKHVGDTGGSVTVSSAANVLGMSVVLGIREVGGVCEMCMCLDREVWEDKGGGEWMRELGLAITNPVGTGGVWTCVCVWVTVFGWCRWGVCRGLDQGLEGWCYVCVSCKILCIDSMSSYLYIVLGGYLRIFGALSVQSCCTLWISASYHVFVYGRYHKSRQLHRLYAVSFGANRKHVIGAIRSSLVMIL